MVYVKTRIICIWMVIQTLTIGFCVSTHEQFVNECLAKHNQLRSQHSSPPLKKADDLINHAQHWANYLAKENTFKHSSTAPQIGENLYSFRSSNPSDEIQADEVVLAWYNEIKNYDFSKPAFSSNTGHFTQVVWKSSRYFGAGVARSPLTGTWYVVANYSPAGNVAGQFPENVLPKR